MTDYVIDFCVEEDGYVNLDSPDLSYEQLEANRVNIERFIEDEAVPRNHYGEINFNAEDMWIFYRPCSEED